MRYNKLGALVAEVRAMELWDRAEKQPSKNEIEARRLRRLEIFSEIDARLSQQIEVLTNVLVKCHTGEGMSQTSD